MCLPIKMLILLLSQVAFSNKVYKLLHSPAEGGSLKRWQPLLQLGPNLTKLSHKNALISLKLHPSNLSQRDSQEDLLYWRKNWSSTVKTLECMVSLIYQARTQALVTGAKGHSGSSSFWAGSHVLAWSSTKLSQIGLITLLSQQPQHTPSR